MSIEQEITSWDGKSSDDIDVIYSRHKDDNLFISKIVELVQQEPLQKGATWLLKRHFDDERQIEDSQSAKIFGLLRNLKCWESKLHILQSLSYMKIANAEKKEIELFLRKCLTDDNKFVRAWAYNGFYVLSMQYSDYIPEVKQFLEMAMRDEAPSVKARIRSILKKDF